MAEKERVLLATYIDAERFQWWTAAVAAEGPIDPLVRSQPGDLSRYVGLDADEQASFLRHRLCSVLQRGCDRLWACDRKADEFVFALSSEFPQGHPNLTQRTADHLHEWMSNPPVTFLVAAADGGQHFTASAGRLATHWQDHFNQQVSQLIAKTSDDALWEEIPLPRA